MSTQNSVESTLFYGCLVAFFLFFCRTAAAQVSVGADQGYVYQPKTSVESLGPNSLGDVVTSYSGSVKFYYKDVDIKGNSEIPVFFARSLEIGIGGGASRWDVELPSIGGVYSASLGWQVSTPGKPNNRCTVNVNNYMEATPPVATGRTGGALPAEFGFSSSEYWYGSKLHIPGQPDQPVMVLTSENNSLSFDSAYKWITPNNWVFSCINSTANGAPGEAFLGRSPDGLTYRFDWMAASSSPLSQQLRKSATVSGGSWLSILDRMLYRLLPTEVSDANGNWVRYSYDPTYQNRVVSISSSDNRSIVISYDEIGRVDQVASNGRVWKYLYTTAGPSKVILPDQSSWNYSFPQNAQVSYGLTPINCADPLQPIGSSWSASVTAPSGLRGDYLFSVVNLGTSYVPRVCDVEDGQYFHLKRYKVEAAVALVKRQLSGPGVAAPLIWTYDYGATNASYLNSPGTGECVTEGCPEIRVITVSKPNNEWVRLTFGNRDSVTEGQLQAEEVGQGNSLLRRTTYTYASGGQEFPVVYGRIPCYRCEKLQERILPLKSQVIEEAGRKFQYKVSHFDSLGRPILVEETSSNLPEG